MVVDDSVVVRRVVTRALSADPEIEVVGSAANGRLALAKVDALQPDLFTMDVEMPEMDGIETVRALRAAGHRQPIIMFSTLTERGAEATLDALAAGATDYMTKPSQVANVAEAISQVRGALVPRIRALSPRRQAPPQPRSAARAPLATPPRAGAAHTAPPTQARREVASTGAPDILAIGCSTGGPEALTTVLKGLPRTFPVPVVVVQHMPPVFTAQFAERLNRLLPFTVTEATSGQPVLPGSVHIAPGDYHLHIVKTAGQLTTQLTQAAPVNFCRPAVDVLFSSVAGACRGRVLAAVLTGMGADGRDGAADIVRAGGSVLVQDQATSVVWGMPGAVATAQLAEQILPLPDIAAALIRRATFVGGREDARGSR
jgi:two-component system chemotaxis response regulator CheB